VALDTARYADNGSSRAGQPASQNDHSAARRLSRTNCASAQIGPDIERVTPSAPGSV